MMHWVEVNGKKKRLRGIYPEFFQGYFIKPRDLICEGNHAIARAYCETAYSEWHNYFRINIPQFRVLSIWQFMGDL